MSSSQSAPRSAFQERIGDAIVDAAIAVLASGGEASMQSIAEEAGVARATIYRYFPSRQELLEEVGRRAVVEVSARLRSSRLEEVPVEEGIARALRALVEAGDLFVVLTRQRTGSIERTVRRQLDAPLRSLVGRGQHQGVIRDDVPDTWLTELLLVLAVSMSYAKPSRGTDDTVADLLSVFLHGAGGDKATSRRLRPI